MIQKFTHILQNKKQNEQIHVLQPIQVAFSVYADRTQIWRHANHSIFMRYVLVKHLVVSNDWN